MGDSMKISKFLTFLSLMIAVTMALASAMNNEGTLTYELLCSDGIKREVPGRYVLRCSDGQITVNVDTIATLSGYLKAAIEAKAKGAVRPGEIDLSNIDVKSMHFILRYLPGCVHDSKIFSEHELCSYEFVCGLANQIKYDLDLNKRISKKCIGNMIKYYAAADYLQIPIFCRAICMVVAHYIDSFFPLVDGNTRWTGLGETIEKYLKGSESFGEFKKLIKEAYYLRNNICLPDMITLDDFIVLLTGLINDKTDLLSFDITFKTLVDWQFLPKEVLQLDTDAKNYIDNLIANRQYKTLQNIFDVLFEHGICLIKTVYAEVINNFQKKLQGLDFAAAQTLFNNMISQENLHQSPTAAMALRLLIARTYHQNVDSLDCDIFYNDLQGDLDGSNNVLFRLQHIEHVLPFIQLYGQQVTGLILGGNALTYIPAQIGNLKNIDYLHLSNNKLQILPKTIANLQNLLILELGSNNFQNFPKAVCQITSLQRLNVSFNHLNRLPTSLTNLVNLFDFSVSNNMFIQLPDVITNLNLTCLQISNNQLKSLPEKIGNLTGLTHLSIGNNNLQSLPVTIGYLNNLEVLEINDNQLQFLPESINSLIKLRTLSLARNQFHNLVEDILKLPEGLQLHLRIGNDQINQLKDQFSSIMQKFPNINITASQG